MNKRIISHALMKAQTDDASCCNQTGNSSVDDPDGKMILEQIHSQLAQADYEESRDDVITVKMPPVDQLLNTIMRCAWLACQVSTKEGFEVKVTEAIHKGIPVLATKAGGIPLQIRDGIDGILVDISDREGMADIFYRKLVDPESLPDIFSKPYEDAQSSEDELQPTAGRWESEGAGPNEEYFTVANATQWGLIWAHTLYGQQQDLQGLPADVVEELRRMHVGEADPTSPYQYLADRVVYSVVSGRESNLV